MGKTLLDAVISKLVAARGQGGARCRSVEGIAVICRGNVAGIAADYWNSRSPSRAAAERWRFGFSVMDIASI